MWKHCMLYHFLVLDLGALFRQVDGSSQTCTTPPIPGPGTEHHETGHNATTWPWQIFKTSPFNPPELQINRSGGALAPGYFFIEPSDFTAKPAVKESAPYIVDDEGQLVWAAPVPGADNFRVQSVDGKPAITFWNGSLTQGSQIGRGYGQVNILNEHYEQIYTICPDLGLTLPASFIGQKCQADFHESQMTDDNTLLVTSYNITSTDLSSIGGPKYGYVLDNVAFELNITNAEILWSWSALQHVPVTATHQPLSPGGNGTLAAPFDYFHMNSIQKYNGHYVINSRHTFSTFYVSANGTIIWTLKGDTGGNFGTLPQDATFAWQHHARIRSSNETDITLSLFNNDNSQIANGTNQTTGLELNLPLPPGSAPITILDRKVKKGDPVYASSQGSYQPLANSNAIEGYGQLPIAREWGPAADGSDLRWEARFGVDNLVQSYRVFKQVWHGKPKTCPSLVVVKAGNGNCAVGKGYVSWNGATDVTSWNVYQGADEQRLQLIGQVPKRGFETRFNVAGTAECVQVGAVEGGKEVGRSAVVCS